MASASKSVSESLWWDPFVSLFEDLDRAPASDDLPIHLVEKVERNHAWFIESVNGFKAPNEASKKVLESDEIVVGSNRIIVKAEMREIALEVSQLAGLDEVQSYILVRRCSNSSISDKKELVQHVVLRYYIERQCLLKCIRRIFVHALYSNDITDSQAMKLINENLQNKLTSLIQDLLSSAFSIKSDMEFTILWVEETLIETNIILDILFLSFYDNLSSCNLDQWKSLCSLFKGMLGGSYDMSKMAVSVESMKSFSHAKSQLLFILIETLDLENLLKLVHDQVPFSEASCAFSLTDIQEIDAELAKFSDELAIESGPLILAWAVHLCLVSSLPGSSMEMDHVNYVRQAFECGPFVYLLEIISSDPLTESDGPVSGFMSIVRTLISAFFAAYELSQSTGDGHLSLILTILCQMYRGEESLCMQFWDKDSFVDGPIRSLLFSLEREYPFQKDDFIRFLSAVCEGPWPSQCVYNYLEKLSGMTTLYRLSSGNVRYKDVVKLESPVGVPGAESLLIPSGTHGYVLRLLEGNGNGALVRWDFTHSGIIVLLLNLAQCLYYDRQKECYHVIDLICRMVKSNKAICFSLLSTDTVLYDQASKLRGQIENDFRIDIVKVMCTAVFNLVNQGSNVEIITNSFGILAELFKCAPCRVLEVALESNLFSTEITVQLIASWILSNGLARLLLTSCEQNGDCSHLTISVLDFISQVVEKGPSEPKIILPLIIFAHRYVLINHLHWKYNKNSRWKTTLKVFELVRDCIRKYPIYHTIGRTVREILLYDSSVLNVIWRVLIISTRALENQAELKDAENIQLVLCTALDIIQSTLNELPDEAFSSLPPFIGLLLSPNSEPMPFSSVANSLFSFFSNPEIQMGSAKVLSALCLIGSKFQSQFLDNTNLVFDPTQISKLRKTICDILSEESNQDESIKITVLDLLTSIASYQPALFSSLSPQVNKSLEINSNANNNTTDDLSKKDIISFMDPILKYLDGSKYLINSSPDLFSSILNLLKALWEGGTQYTDILDNFKNSKKFWDNLFSCFSPNRDKSSVQVENGDKQGDKHLSSRFSCQSAVLEIASHELFFQEKISQNEKSEKRKDQNVKEALNKFFSNRDTEELIKSYISSGNTNNSIFRQAKISISICILDIIKKIFTGNKNKGSLSVSLVKKIEEIYNKLLMHPAFSHALSSEKDQIDVLNKLHNYLEKSLSGHEIPSGPFNDLFNFLSDSDLFKTRFKKPDKENHMYDMSEARMELGFDMWAHLSEWRDSAELAEKMFVFMHKANSFFLVQDSKLGALRAFLMALTVYKETGGCTVSEAFILSSIKSTCKSLQSTLDNLLISQTLNPQEEISTFTLVSTQTEFLLTLTKSLKSHKNSIPLIKQTASSALGTLTEVKVNSLNPKFIKTIKLFLLIQLEIFIKNPTGEDNDSTGEDPVSEFNTTSLVLAPLCKFLENAELANLALACLDLTLKGNSVNLNVLLPILQKHLPIQTLLQKLITKSENGNENGDFAIVLNFFLTLASTNGGAKLLYSANFLSFLKPFMNNLFAQNDMYTPKNIYILTLGFSIINSLVHFTSTDPCSSDVINDSISFVLEKSELLSIYLSAPDCPTNDKKRPRSNNNNNNTQITLAALTLTEQYIFLIYTLSKFKHSVAFNAGISESLIHLLAFISKGNVAKLPFCPPSCKEELKMDKSSGIIKTKKGWFGNGSDPTRFGETVALRIYEIALLVLSFLCSQAELAVQRAEELRFVDLVNSPDLPTPQILHGLQDQVIGILVEVLTEAGGKLKGEKETVCLLLVQVLERSIFLELCVSFLCGLRPVIGRVEDFSREIKPLLNGMKDRAEFKGYVRSLNEAIALLYPELLHGGDLL
ncbi:hypothetical protein LUZ60_015146 [Juncus effusus]|nr:hypothetical protein LUZ60_015146 [Juncus effusus]